MSAVARIADDVLSVRMRSPAHAQAGADALAPLDGVIDIAPGMESLALLFDPLTADISTLKAALLRAAGAPEPEAAAGPIIKIPVAYGGDAGPDLEAVAAEAGLSARDVIDRHLARLLNVDMLGFTPGFAYLGGLDPRLAVSRLATPRAHLPAGSIGVCGGQTGLYALAGPGGWKIIGRTNMKLFDPDADPPFVVRPGMRVRFKEART